ncbi:hypothetical protein [Streptomyces sp. NPDC060205]
MGSSRCDVVDEAASERAVPVQVELRSATGASSRAHRSSRPQSGPAVT